MNTLLATILFLVLSAPKVFSQDSIMRITSPDLFEKNHMSLTFGLMMSHSQSEKKIGERGIKTPVAFGYNSVGFLYTINFHKNIGVLMGVNIGVQEFAFKVNVQQSDTPSDYSRDSEFILGIEFPYSFIARFKMKPKLYLFAEAGIGFRTLQKTFVSSSSVSDTLHNDLLKFSSNVEYGSTNLNICYSLGGGVLISLKSDNLLKIGLKTSIGHNQIVEGEYAYYQNGNQIASGNFFSYGTYYGLGIEYIFTQLKK